MLKTVNIKLSEFIVAMVVRVASAVGDGGDDVGAVEMVVAAKGGDQGREMKVRQWCCGGGVVVEAAVVMWQRG
ncbi:hypothetical protein Tco_0216241 [Tanacetum coccineum]